MADLLAIVERFERGWLLLDRAPDVRPGDEVFLGFQAKPICSAIVLSVKGTRLKTDFNLFFAGQGDDLLRGSRA